MKTLFLFLFFSLLFSFNSYSQDILSVIKKYDIKIEEQTNDKYKLLLISSSGCGYCSLALKRIQTFEDKIKIIIIDYGEVENLDGLKSTYPYLFLEGAKIKKLGKQNFFPKLYLYDKNDKLIWKKKGWSNSNLEEINSKVQ